MKNRVFAFSLSLILITAAFISPSLANSAPRFWQGTDTSGVIAAADDCPLTVERETLTFDIGEFPDTYYERAFLLTRERFPPNTFFAIRPITR